MLGGATNGGTAYAAPVWLSGDWVAGARCQGRGPSPSYGCNPQASGPLRRVLHGSHLGYHTPNLQGTFVAIGGVALVGGV